MALLDLKLSNDGKDADEKIDILGILNDDDDSDNDRDADEKNDDEEKIDLLADDESDDEEADVKDKDKKLPVDDKEDPEEEDLELTTPARRKDILKAYPDLFKKFPYLEKAYYREQAFTEVNPTIEDAKETKERAQEFDKFEASLLKGSSVELLKSVKSADEGAFVSLVDNYLPNLKTADKDAFEHIVGNLTREIVANMASVADSNKNEDLKAAAILLHRFMFGENAVYKAPFSFKNANGVVAKDTKATEEETEISKEKEEWQKQKYDDAVSALTTKTDSAIKSTIDQNIDTKGLLTPYVKKTAVKECMELLDKTISKDTRFITTLNKLWEKAGQENYSKVSLDNIRSAYISKAKTYLPQLISKVRNEALKGSGRGDKISSERDEQEPLKRNKELKSTPDKTSKSNSKDDKYKGKSTLDILNMD